MTTPNRFTPETLAKAAASRATAKSAVELVKQAGLNVDSTTEAKILARVENMPHFCRRTYLTAMRGRSRNSAVKAFCSMCMGWERVEIPLCTDPACPLFPYRPYVEHASGPEEPEEPDETEGHGD